MAPRAVLFPHEYRNISIFQQLVHLLCCIPGDHTASRRHSNTNHTNKKEMCELKCHVGNTAITKIRTNTLYCSQIDSLKSCVNLKEESWILYILILIHPFLFTITLLPHNVYRENLYAGSRSIRLAKTQSYVGKF